VAVNDRCGGSGASQGNVQSGLVMLDSCKLFPVGEILITK